MLNIDYKLLLISLLIGITLVLMYKALNIVVKSKGNRKSKIYKRIKVANTIYKQVTRVPIIGDALVNVRKRLYVNSYGKKHIVRFQAVMYYFISWIITIIVFLILARAYGNSAYITAVIAFLCYYIKTVALNLIIGDDTKLLRQFAEFLQDVQHEYNKNNKMVEVAIYEATQQAPQLMNLHGNALYKSIQSQDKLDEYYDNCPNNEFKLFAGYCLLTKEYGDTEVNDTSLFIKDINKLVFDVREELFKRDQLRYWLKFLTTIAIIPALLPNILGKMVMDMFPQTVFFFGGSIGLISKILILMLSVVCFFIIRQFESTMDKQGITLAGTNRWEMKLLKFKPVKIIVNATKPKGQTKEYRKKASLIQDAGVYLNMEWLQLRMMLAAILTVIIVIGLFITVHKMNFESIFNNTYKMYSQSEYVQDSLGKTVDINVYESKVLKELKGKAELRTVDYILKRINEMGVDDDEVKKLLAKGIVDKLNAASTQHIKWFEILIALIVGLLATDIPILFLKIQKKLRRKDFDEEVYQFNTIIMLLMHHKTVDTRIVLEWMENFADIFKNPIRSCLNAMNDQEGVEEALNKLKTHANYKPFSKIVDNLIMAENIGIEEAFISLAVDNEFYKDERKERNRRSVHEKVSISEDIGFLPAYALIAIYVALPMLWACWNQFMEIYELMQNINH